MILNNETETKRDKFLDSIANLSVAQAKDIYNNCKFTEEQLYSLVTYNCKHFKLFKKENISERIIIEAIVADKYNMEFVPFWNDNILEVCTDCFDCYKFIPKEVQTEEFITKAFKNAYNKCEYSYLKYLDSSKGLDRFIVDYYNVYYLQYLDYIHDDICLEILAENVDNIRYIANPSEFIKNAYRLMTL